MLDVTPDKLLRQATCAVLKNGRVCGTAWLVSHKGYLLTAGHIFDPDDYTVEIQVRFPEDIPRRVYVTNYAHYPDGGLDYAVLKLEAVLTGHTPLPISLSKEVSGPFRLYGYGKTLSHRSAGHGCFLAPFDPNDVQGHRLFQLRSPEIGESGFSGAAVFSDELGAVAGIQIEATRANVGAGRDSILAMPLYRVAQMWSELETIATTATSQLSAESLTAIPASKAVHSNGSSSATKRSRIFLSYKGGRVPDEPVALQAYEAFCKDHDVFIDQQSIVFGVDWAKQIEQELARADYLITFLSDASVNSEMVQREIAMAYEMGRVEGKNAGPIILPIRLAHTEPFSYPLSAYLNHINWALWNDSSDTTSLIEELKRVVGGNERSLPARTEQANTSAQTKYPATLPQPLPSAQLEMPEGTMDPDSKFYVQRPGDAVAINAMRRQGVTITIKGPRQVGKSSLLVQIIQEARTEGKEIVLLDFQQIGKRTLNNIESLVKEFCISISDILGVEDRVEEYWQVPLSTVRRCTRYMERYILKELGSPLLLAMDEVDIIFDTPCRSDFFGMLRSWHNSRAINPVWKNIDLTLVTSTEPYQFIDDLNQSPFNVGEIIEPVDFTAEQIADLVGRHSLPLSLTQPLLTLLSGHPYLTRRALYLLAAGRMTLTDLLHYSISDRGPFGDHLRSHLFRLHDKPELVAGLLQVIELESCPDDRIAFRLQGAGLVRREHGNVVVPRCTLYAEYFREHLHV